MKIPAFAIVLVIVVVGYLVLRSVLATLKFSTKIMTWVILLAIAAGAFLFFQQNQTGEDGLQIPLQSERNDGFSLR